MQARAHAAELLCSCHGAVGQELWATVHQTSGRSVPAAAGTMASTRPTCTGEDSRTRLGEREREVRVKREQQGQKEEECVCVSVCVCVCVSGVSVEDGKHGGFLYLFKGGSTSTPTHVHKMNNNTAKTLGTIL